MSVAIQEITMGHISQVLLRLYNRLRQCNLINITSPIRRISILQLLIEVTEAIIQVDIMEDVDGK